MPKILGARFPRCGLAPSRRARTHPLPLLLLLLGHLAAAAAAAAELVLLLCTRSALDHRHTKRVAQRGLPLALDLRREVEAAAVSAVAAAVVVTAVAVAFAVVLAALVVGVRWLDPAVVGLAVGACSGLDEVDEAVEDADLAFEFGAVDEGFIRNLDEVEACEF